MKGESISPGSAKFSMWDRPALEHRLRRCVRGSADQKRWAEAYMGGGYAKKTMAALREEGFERRSPCEVLYHEGRRRSFAEIAAGADATARRAGIAPGDKVALWIPNRPERREMVAQTLEEE